MRASLQVRGSARRSWANFPVCGFTMIEIMIVVAIMGIVLAMGAPVVFKIRKREPLNQSVRDVVEVLNNARAQAIMQGKVTEVILHPKEGRLDVSGAGTAVRTQVPTFGYEPPAGSAGAREAAPQDSSGLSAQISDRVTIEMMDVNLLEYKDQELGKVRFYPNGTCDEFTLILRSEKGDWIKVWLEVTTSLANVGPVER